MLCEHLNTKTLTRAYNSNTNLKLTRTKTSCYPIVFSRDNEDQVHAASNTLGHNDHGPSGIVIVPQGETRIRDSAFIGCMTLTSLSLPDTLRVIESSAFRDCNGLTSLTLPDSVTHIDECAFRNCSALTSVTLPNTLTKF